MILVFRHGVGSCLLGFQRVDSIEAWVPLFLFSVLFGLSMDYQVFLLSRIKERYDASGSTTEAVTYGVASTARLVQAAMRLLGDWNWYLPRWLEWLPRIEIEATDRIERVAAPV